MIIIDSDIGVDDAGALAYLLTLRRSEVSILGITTVTGNTSDELLR